MTGEGLQWWELLSINNRNIETFTEFKVETLNYFEPVNRELRARKTLSNLKQIGSLNAARAYNKEFSKWLLQIPTMTPAEQIFHYSQGLKHRTRITGERSEPTTLQEVMRIADRPDSLYNGNIHLWALVLILEVRTDKHQCKLERYLRRGIIDYRTLKRSDELNKAYALFAKSRNAWLVTIAEGHVKKVEKHNMMAEKTNAFVRLCRPI